VINNKGNKERGDGDSGGWRGGGGGGGAANDVCKTLSGKQES